MAKKILYSYLDSLILTAVIIVSHAHNCMFCIQCMIWPSWTAKTWMWRWLHCLTCMQFHIFCSVCGMAILDSHTADLVIVALFHMHAIPSLLLSVWDGSPGQPHCRCGLSCIVSHARNSMFLLSVWVGHPGRPLHLLAMFACTMVCLTMLCHHALHTSRAFA
jgi:hypothetical protein